MLKLSYAGCLGLSPAISSQFSVEMCAASKNCEKFTKNPFLGVQGCSKSLMLMNLKSLSPVLVMIGSMSVLICKCFHTIKANIGKITSFRGLPLFDALIQEEPCIQGHKILSQKTRDLGAAHSEDFVILACTVLIQITSVTDRRTDRQTPRRWLRRMKHSAIAHKKVHYS